MSKIKILAGDFIEGVAEINWKDEIGLKVKRHGGIIDERMPVDQLELVEVASEENVKKVGGTVGWGAAGALVLGPVGLLAGLLLGGKKKEITFVAKFKDGRKFMGTTDNKLFTKLKAAAF